MTPQGLNPWLGPPRSAPVQPHDCWAELGYLSVLHYPVPAPRNVTIPDLPPQQRRPLWASSKKKKQKVPVVQEVAIELDPQKLLPILHDALDAVALWAFR